MIGENHSVIMHNAQYDLGCLMSLGISIEHLKVYDTRIMAALWDSELPSYSLDFLLRQYFGTQKAQNRLVDVVRNFNLCPDLKPANKTFTSAATKWAYSNMNIVQAADPGAMADYANQDITGTGILFKFLYEKLGDQISAYYSNIAKICIEIRAKGIKIDINAVNHGIDTLRPIVENLEVELLKELGSINLHSPKQLLDMMKQKGYSDFPKTAADGESVRAEYLEERPNDPLCSNLLKYRTYYKLLNDFLLKIQSMQEYTFGYVFPELNVLAARTGRFSSSNPNIQNIPKRNKEYAALCRAIFIPTNSKNSWYSADWANQEGRLQLHYSQLKGFTKAQWWLDKFKENPSLDTHLITARMMFNDQTLTSSSPERTKAKTIYLGKSFCMGGAKLCKRMGLPSEIKDTKFGKMEMAGLEGQKLIDAFDRAFPYLKELQKDTMQIIQERGHIKTLGGRISRRPRFKPGDRSQDYKAISKLIQGSALDQMCAALTHCHNEKIDIKCIVHDEIDFEGTIEDAKKVKEIMETCVDLVVPSVAELSEGPNWGNLKKLKLL